MDKFNGLAQYFGIFLLISGVGPLSIAVFGSFIIDPTPMDLYTFWREAPERTLDLYVHQQVLGVRYDTNLSLATKRNIFCDTTSFPCEYPKSADRMLNELRLRVQIDPAFALDMYHQYYEWRGPDAGGLAVRRHDAGYVQRCKFDDLQDRDRVFFEEQRQRVVRLRFRYVLLWAGMAAAGWGLCLWGWSHK